MCWQKVLLPTIKWKYIKHMKSSWIPFHAVVHVSKPQLNARPHGDPLSLLVSQLSHLPTFSCRYHIHLLYPVSQHPSLLFPTDSILFFCPRPPCYRAPATVLPLSTILCLLCYFFATGIAGFSINILTKLTFCFLPPSRDVPVYSVRGGGRGHSGWTRHRRGLGHGGEHRRELSDQRGRRPIQSQRWCRVAEGCCLHQEGTADRILRCSPTSRHGSHIYACKKVQNLPRPPLFFFSTVCAGVLRHSLFVCSVYFCFVFFLPSICV